MLIEFDEQEWSLKSNLPLPPGADALLKIVHESSPMLRSLGWSPNHIWVLDLQTGEGGHFYPGGYAPADLNKHRIWVYPMYEPFLIWLYQQDLSNIEELPRVVEFTEEQAPSALAGYRRDGPCQS